MAVKLKILYQTAGFGVVKPPIKFVLLVCCYRLYLLLPVSPVTPMGVYSFGRVGLASLWRFGGNFYVMEGFFSSNPARIYSRGQWILQMRVIKLSWNIN